MGIIEVHAEVYAICPHFVYRVISKVIEAVVDEMSRLIQCVTGFNASGALQVSVMFVFLIWNILIPFIMVRQ